MCGLTGIAGKTDIKLREAFVDMLLVTQLRGRDSTGVFTVNAKDETKLAKDVGPPDSLFDRKSFDQALWGVPKIMAGHCRSKTIGDNTRENAHPYDFDDVIGMHNGTLRSHYQMEGYDYKKTDSHALYSLIDKYGVEETVRKLDPDGAWALVWWDKVDNRLNFLRNDKRPLWFAWTKDKTAMIWSSEPWMFSAAARVVDLWDGKEEGKDDASPYFQLPPNTLWSFSINGAPKQGERHITFHQPRELKAEERKPVGFSNRSSVLNNGGQVANPFHHGCENAYERFSQRQQDKLKLLDDHINDVGTKSQEESSTTSNTPSKSKNTSSNVLDFRRGPTPSTSSAKKTLSLTSKYSKPSQPKDNEGQTDSSKGQSEKTNGVEWERFYFPRVSVREVAGVPYISHKDTSTEISLPEFESRTGGKCSFCNTPIGGLEEVAAFTDKVLSAFICTTCTEEPKVAVVG